VEQITGASVATVGVLVGMFSWEILHGATVGVPPVGLFRSASSPDRQYLPIEHEGGFYGACRDWKSSDLSLEVTQVFSPPNDLRDDTDDFAKLLPDQALKFLRYYVLARCFGRQGEGFRPNLASHYEGRFRLGIQLFKRLLDVAHKDRDFTRIPITAREHRPPRVRLPAEFPRVA